MLAAAQKYGQMFGCIGCRRFWLWDALLKTVLAARVLLHASIRPILRRYESDQVLLARKPPPSLLEVYTLTHPNNFV